MRSGRPLPGEFATYAADDIDAVEGDDAVEVLRTQGARVEAMLGGWTDEAVAGVTYAAGKWTLREVIGHLIDDERIFVYRALCFARGDQQSLPGFDENDYVAGARFDDRPLADHLAELREVRAATLRFFVMGDASVTRGRFFSCNRWTSGEQEGAFLPSPLRGRGAGVRGL